MDVVFDTNITFITSHNSSEATVHMHHQQNKIGNIVWEMLESAESWCSMISAAGLSQQDKR